MADSNVLNIMATLPEMGVHPDANQRPSKLPKGSAYQYVDTWLKFVLYNCRRPFYPVIYFQSPLWRWQSYRIATVRELLHL